MDARICRTRPNMRSTCRAAQKLAITLQPASDGDTDTLYRTLAEAQSAARKISERAVEEVVADKGYHSGAVLKELHQQGVRTYIPEPDRGRRKWEGKAVEQKRTYESSASTGRSRPTATEEAQ